jgi:glycosyltransferase involved in cell wall biosynthesis
MLIYVGYVNYSRGLDTVIESFYSIPKKIQDFFHLVIVGTGTAEEELKMLVKKQHLQNSVDFEGWVDNKLVPGYIASSDICLVPHHKCSHWDNTIPNKIFDYMAAKKPVLVSDAIPAKRLVLQSSCGLVFDSGDKESFIKQLVKLTDNRLRNTLGQNGFKAIQDKYNWENDSNFLLETLKRHT